MKPTASLAHAARGPVLASHATRTTMACLAVESCLAVLANERPPIPVNPEVLPP